MQKLSDLKKAEIILNGFQKDLAVKELCRKYSISASTYYRYKKQVVRAIASMITRSKADSKKYPC